MPREDLAAAGSQYETGAMGGDVNDPEMPRDLTNTVPAQRRQSREEKPQSIYAEPNFEAQEQVEVEAEPDRPARKVQPRAEPPQFDWMQESAQARQRAREENQQFLRNTAAPMLDRLSKLPDPRTVPPDQVAALTPEENARYMQAIAERAQLESNIGMLPVLANMQNQIGDKLATDITHIQRQVAERYPDIAAAVLDNAKTMPFNAQAMPETYEFLVRNELGRQVQEKDAQKRISSAGARVSSGGRGGFGSPVRQEVSREQEGQLARLFSGMTPERRAVAMRVTKQNLSGE